MAEFIQIGCWACNVDQITDVLFESNEVLVYLAGVHHEPFILEGEEANAFRHWWETQAKVYKAL